jgi:hypothetical protein
VIDHSLDIFVVFSVAAILFLLARVGALERRMAEMERKEKHGD